MEIDPDSVCSAPILGPPAPAEVPRTCRIDHTESTSHAGGQAGVVLGAVHTGCWLIRDGSTDMMSGPHAHKVVAQSIGIGDPPPGPSRMALGSIGSLRIDLDDGPLPRSRQRIVVRPVVARTRVGGGGTTLVITLGDASRLRIDLDSAVGSGKSRAGERPETTIPSQRS